MAIHFITQSAPDFRCKIQRATAGRRRSSDLLSNLLYLSYLVFNNRDMAEKAECVQRNTQKAPMMAEALSTHRP